VWQAVFERHVAGQVEVLQALPEHLGVAAVARPARFQASAATRRNASKRP